MISLLKYGLLFSLLFTGSQLTATELNEFSVLMLGPLDGKAVVKLPDGKMKVIGMSETLPGTQAVVKQILSDRLVVEDRVSGDADTPATQTVWLYKVANPGEKSRVQRLQRTPPPQEIPSITAAMELNKDK